MNNFALKTCLSNVNHENTEDSIHPGLLMQRQRIFSKHSRSAIKFELLKNCGRVSCDRVNTESIYAKKRQGTSSCPIPKGVRSRSVFQFSVSLRPSRNEADGFSRGLGLLIAQFMTPFSQRRPAGIIGLPYYAPESRFARRTFGFGNFQRSRTFEKNISPPPPPPLPPFRGECYC